MICFEIAMFTYMPTKKNKDREESEKKTAERLRTKNDRCGDY